VIDDHRDRHVAHCFLALLGRNGDFLNTALGKRQRRQHRKQGWDQAGVDSTRALTT
jgi:hypothetical protein